MNNNGNIISASHFIFSILISETVAYDKLITYDCMTTLKHTNTLLPVFFICILPNMYILDVAVCITVLYLVIVFVCTLCDETY